MAFMETSACKATNVEEAFQLMIKGNWYNWLITLYLILIEIFNKFHKQMEDEEEEIDVGQAQVLINGKQEKKNNCCIQI